MSKSKLKTLANYKDGISSGVWFLLHTNAERAQTPELMKSYSINFHNLCEKMNSCGCDDHCKTTLELLPPENYFHWIDDDGIPEGCLKHSHEFHNSVNKRLGKDEPKYKDVKLLYRPKKDDPQTPCKKNHEEKLNSHKNARKRHFYLVSIDDYQ
jgi:hypothetical protein